MNTLKKIGADLVANRLVYLLALPVVLYYLIFAYLPMYGVVIAFKDYNIARGFFEGDWVGLKHFQNFFDNMYAARIIWNTISINILELVFGFPAPIILALLLNEVRNKPFKRIVQSISYIPHFISMVVICGILLDFFSPSGVINILLKQFFGFEPLAFFSDKSWFQPLYVGSGIWQGIGWGTIIYLASMTSISTELYEAVEIDGGNRWTKLMAVTLPALMPTIVILLILRMGSMMSVGFEKIILLYNPITYETADVISSFVYRKGLMEAQFSFSTAVGLFNSVINFGLLVLSNFLSKKFNGHSLW